MPASTKPVLTALLFASVALSPGVSAGTGESDWKRATALLAEGDARAIDLMKSAFFDEQDMRTRQQIASMLVSLRVADDRYYDFLVGFTRQVIDRNTPTPVALSSMGQTSAGELSEEFIQWCAERQVDPRQAAHQAIYEDAGHFIFLAQAGDARSLDMLLEALEVRNYFVAVQAALGLAIIGDDRAIEPIVRLSQRAPADSGLFIAQALLHFEDPRATAEAAKLVPEGLLPALRQEVERERHRRAELEALIAKLGLAAKP